MAITDKGLERIQSVAGIDTYCVLRTMEEEKLNFKEALLAYKKYYKKYSEGKEFVEAYGQGGIFNPQERQRYLDAITKNYQADKLKLYDVLTKYADHIQNLQDPVAMKDPVSYLMSTVEEVNSNMPYASHNASDVGKQLAREMSQHIYNRLQDANVYDMALSGNIDKEVADILSKWHDEGFRPDKDSMAYKVAEIIQESEDLRYFLLNENGAHVPYLKNRIAGTWMKSEQILSVPINEVVDDFMKWLHPDSFKYADNASPEDIVKNKKYYIHRMLEKYTDVHDGLFSEVLERESLNDRYLDKYEASRNIKFVNNEAMLEAMKKYGHGSLIENVAGSASGTAKTIGLLQRFGADPDLGYSLLRRHVLKNFSSKIVDLPNKILKADNAYQYARGLLKRIGTSWKYDLATMGIAHTRMVKYGGIAWSALKDFTPSIFAVQSLTGKNPLPIMGKLLGKYLGNLGSGEARRLAAARAGLVLETHLHRDLKRLAEEGVDPRALSGRMARRFNSPLAGKITDNMYGKLPDFIHNMTFINQVTDANRVTFADILAMEFHDMRGVKWDDLYEGTRNGFKRAGITPDEWDIIRNLDTKDSFGLNLHTVVSAPLDKFGSLAKKKAVLKKMKMLFYDWSNTASPTGGNRESRIFDVSSLDPNSTVHNIIRLASIGMKTPIKAGNTTMKLLYNSLNLNDMGELVRSKDGMKMFAHILMYYTTLSYLTDSLRKIANGQEVDDPTSLKTWEKSMVTSGMLGVLGDYMFGEYEKFYRNPSKVLLGPGFGSVDDILTLGAKIKSKILEGEDPTDVGGVSRLLWKSMPGNNLWFMPILIRHLMGGSGFQETVLPLPKE